MPQTNLQFLISQAGKNKNFIHEMLDLYLEKTPEYIQLMEKHCKKQNWKALSQINHHMRVPFKYMGLNGSINIIKEIDHHISTKKEYDQIPALVAELRIICDKTYDELKVELSRLKDSN